MPGWVDQYKFGNFGQAPQGPMSTGPNQFYFPSQPQAFNPLPNQNAQLAWPGGGISAQPGYGSVSQPRIGAGGGGFPETGSPFGNVTPPPQINPMDAINEQMKGNINKGWDEYAGQLGNILNQGLPGQRTAQEQIAQGAYQGGVNQLGSQKAKSEQELATQKVASLKDLSSNVANLFKSGSVYLGARGAGDSSAANQYAYAISKMGTKARGDIMSQANQRMSQIGDIYNTETNRLQTELQTRIASIADWFNQMQNQLRTQIGQAGVGRSQDLNALSSNLLNQAMQGIQIAQQEMANRRSSLESWAMSNSKTVQELIGNMQAIGSSMPQFQGIQTSMPQVTSQGQYFPGYGGTDERLKGLFG